LQKIAPGRKLPAGDVQRPAEVAGAVNMSFGTDWGAVAAAWLTEWERTRNRDIYTKLTNSMATIAAQPHGFLTGGAPMDLKTGKFAIDTGKKVSVSHLNASFGLPETIAELLQTIEMLRPMNKGLPWVSRSAG
jgi:YetA-like protein